MITRILLFCALSVNLQNVFLLPSQTDTTEDGVRDYCQWESFKPACPAGHVIVMRKALYGRMTSGECVKRDYGYVGCETDVLRQSDYRCSGQRQCTIEIPDKVFDKTNPCPEDLRRYLQAKYDCVPVINAPRSKCLTPMDATIKATSGYLASTITDESGCGSADTPWVVNAAPGQRLNITLHDFALTSTIPNNTTRHSSSGRHHCHVYAIVKEQDGSHSFTICGGENREAHVYTSTTSALEIRMLGGRNSRTTRHYMLQYEAVGCANPSAPRGGWIKRHDATIIGGCNSDNSIEWKITCVNGVWSDIVGNCTNGDYPAALLSLGTLSHSTSLVLIVIIALFIGVVVLIIGLVCLKRYYPKRHAQASKSVIHNVGAHHQHMEPKYDSNTEYHKRAQPLLNYQDSNRMEENEYAYIDDVIPPPPPPHYQIDDKTRIKDNMVHIDYSQHNGSLPRRQNSQSTQGHIPAPPQRYPVDMGFFRGVRAGVSGVQPQYFVLAPDERESQYNINNQIPHIPGDRLYEHTSHDIGQRVFAV